MSPAEPSRFAPGAKAVSADTPAWVLALERAQAHLHRAARALEDRPPSRRDVRPAAHALTGAIGGVLSAIDGRGDRNGLVDDATIGAEAALFGIMAAEPDDFAREARSDLEHALRELASANDALARIPAELPAPVPDVIASRDRPGLHTLERGTLLPAIRVAAPIPPPPKPPAPIAQPRTLQELEQSTREVRRRAEARRNEQRERRERERLAAAARRAASQAVEPTPGFAVVVAPAQTATAFVEARARDCFEEVAMVGIQRAPLPGEPWREPRVLERRMLASIDAVAALGSLGLARVEPLVRDAPAKDPARGFAAAMILGCFAGRDALAAVERVVRHLGTTDPASMRAVASGLALAPTPALAGFLRTLLGDADPELRALAVGVLARRGLATEAELVAAASEQAPEVVAAALPALALAHPAAIAAIAPPLFEHDDPAVREAAWIASSLGGLLVAKAALARELGGPLVDRAAIPLALVGDEDDARHLLERARKAPSAALVTALGWAGSFEAASSLVGWLASGEPALQAAAAEALERITGARLLEKVLAPPDNLAAPEVDDPDVGEPPPLPLARAVSDPRDMPSDGSPDTIVRPTRRAERWNAYLRERKADFRAGVRYRRGRPYTPLVALGELDRGLLGPTDRRLVHRELVVRTGQVVPFDPDDLVIVQEEALVAWQPIAARASSTPGAWTRPLRRWDPRPHAGP